MSHRLLLVHPHPDDESIACGGVAARALQQGHEVTIVTCTGGEEGENQAGIDLGGRSMPEVRREEMTAAIDALGNPRHRWLGYRDSGMMGEPSNEHPDAFHAVDLEEAATRLAAMVRELRPQVVVSDDEHGTYGHPDHVKAHHVTTRALELAARSDAPGLDGDPWSVAKRYVSTRSRSRTWRFHEALKQEGLASPFDDPDDPPAGPEDLPWGVEDDEVTARIDVSDVMERKRAAMAAHRSQIGDDSFFLNTPPSLDQEAFAVEEYVLLDGVAAPAEDGLEHDLFAGLPA